MKKNMTDIQNMFGLLDTAPVYKLPYYIDNTQIIAFIACIVCAIPIFKNILTINPKKVLANLGVNIWLLIMFILSWATMAASTYNPFIYFRF